MRSSAGIGSLLNNKRDFFIRGFDGKLKEASFILKLSPYIEKDITIVAALTPIIKVKGYLMILDKAGNIIEAEDSIWSNLDLNQSQKILMRNIADISEKFSIMSEIVQAGKTILAEMKAKTIVPDKNSQLDAVC